MPRNKVESVFNHWTPLSQAEFNTMMLDFRNFCEKGSMIVNKNGKAVPFKLNEAQVVTAKLILQHAFAAHPSPSNILIHKSRQMGISVLIAKIEQYLGTRLSNFNAQHLMPTEPDADDLCDKKFVPQLQGTHPQLLPQSTAITRRVKFKEFHGVKLNSSVTFSSAQQQAPGHGQPLDDNTLVPTPNGFIRHGELSVGDTVFDKDGNETRVEAIYPQGFIDLYRVTLSDGSFVDAGLTHRWEVSKSKGRIGVMTTADMISRLDKGLRTMLPKNKSIKLSTKNLPIDPYQLGVILGDGRIDPEGRVYVYSMDNEILEKFDGDKKVQPNNRSFRVYCRGLGKAIRGLGLAGKRSWEKEIPEEYLWGDEIQRKALLAGLLDTDGGISNNQIEFTSTSEVMAKQVLSLVKSLGGYGRIISRDKLPHRRQYRVLLRTNFNPFGITRKKERWSFNRNIRFLSVVSIEKVSRELAMCIAVDSPTHTYLATEDYIVTHNTNQMVVEDEHAHYERVDRLERGMLATMPKMGLSIRIVVSTAYGLNHFYDASKQAQSSPHWDYLFLPWHMLEEYEREPEGRLKDLTQLTDYELKLCDIFEAAGYPVEKWVRKMAWYDYTLHTEAKMDQEHMFENYPSTADESFSATGAPVLPASKLRYFMDNPKKFDYIEATSDISGATNITESTMSTIKRWETPTKGRKYIVGVDPAEGGSDGDFSAAVVIDLTTMENVCCIKEKLDQNEFAEVLNIIGRYYNNAQIVVERNTGQTLIDWLVMLRYPNIFVDAFKSTANRVVYGIYMTPSVKRDAIARAKFLLNADIYKDYDPDFLDSALHFVWKKTPSGLQKAIGSDGYSDDEVMARLIAFGSLNMNKYRGWQNGKERQL